jgi:hypothetical protein
VLVPIQHQLGATATIVARSTVLEAGLPVKPVLNPTLYVRNRSALVTLRVTISCTMDYGSTNVNPLFSGTFTNVLVQRDVPPGGLLVHRFAASALQGDLLTHTLTLQTLSGSADVSSLLIGQYDDVGSVPPSLLPVTF